MKKISGVIFDMDGVVFDSESLWKEGFVKGNEKFGIELSEEFRQGICGKSEKMIRDEIRAIYPDFDADTYRSYIIDFVAREVEAGNFDVKDGFLDLVHYFKAKGYKVALATSSFRGRAERMFKKKNMDLYDLFDAYSFLEDVGANSKPNPYIFKITADKMNVPYDECAVLEDSMNGIVAATNGGMVPLHVLDLIPPDNFCKEHAFAMVNSLEEVKKYL